MVFDRPDMPYAGQQGLKHFGAIQEAVRFLDERSRQTNPGAAHKAIAGAYKAPNATQGNKRKAEDNLPEELQLFQSSTGQKKGKYYLDLRIPMPQDPAKIVADRIRERIIGVIGQEKPIEVEPEDVGMVETKVEVAPKEEQPANEEDEPSPKKGRQVAQAVQK